MSAFDALLARIRDCTICEPHLADGVRPVVQAHGRSRILVAGQAPGRRVHESGIPFDDPSGDRLRDWMGVDRETFYDPQKVAIVPMGFCFPGTGASGDLPPRPECAEAWRQEVLDSMKRVELTLVIGAYAMDWHLGTRRESVTSVVSRWKEFRPRVVPMPHPSPRNRRWLATNAWFERDVVPYVRRSVRRLL